MTGASTPRLRSRSGENRLLPSRTVIPLTVVLILLVSPLAIFASAQGGGLLMDTSTLSIAGNMGVGDGDVNISVDVKAHDVAANGSLNISLISGVSEIVASDNFTLNFSADEVATLFLNVSSLPVGQYTLNLQLYGDIGVAFGNNSTQQTQFVKRLAPANPTLSAPTAWSAIPADGTTGVASGNSTFRDGDSGWLEVPTENLGEVGWGGEISLVIDGGSAITQNISIPPLSTTVANFSLPILNEDESISLTINLSGIIDTLHIEVGPPPLPLLNISALPDIEVPSLGDEVVWSVNISNSGETTWDGQFSCTFSGATVADEQLSIPVDGFLNQNVTLVVRPGSLSCSLSSTSRIDDLSILEFNHSYDMDAAHFSGASSTGLVVAGGELHVGDTLHASLIVHNGGDMAGDARLVLTDSSGSTEGSSRQFQVGDSLQLETDHTLSGASGQRTIQWSLVSENGLVDDNLSGEIVINVTPSQQLLVEIASAEWTTQSGISEVIELTLSEGQARSVRVQSGFVVSGENIAVFDYPVHLNPGIRTISLNLGEDPSAEGVWVSVSEVNWLSSVTSELEDSRQVSPPSISPTVVLGVADPAVPLSNEPVSLRYTLTNDGGDDSPVGVLVLTKTSTGEVLWEGSAPLVEAGSSESGFIELDSWPQGTTVDVELEWRVNGGQVVAVKSYPSKTAESDESWVIPWSALIYGAIAGAVISAIARFVFVWQGQDPEERARLKDERRAARDAARKEAQRRLAEKRQPAEKQEVACPECDMTLRVPSDYSGQARCPACTNVFSVEAKVEKSVEPVEADDVDADSDRRDEVEEVKESQKTPQPVVAKAQKSTERDDLKTSISKPESAKKQPKKGAPSKQKGQTSQPLREGGQQSSSSADDEIRCPECGQRLRVPYERRPITAKCARCECRFTAEKK